MAARFWRWMLGVVVAVAAALATAVAVTLSLSLAQTLWIALINLLALPIMLVGISFAFARAGAEDPCPLLNAPMALRAVSSEAARFSLAMVAMSRNPRERQPTAGPAAAASSAGPVLLIHGFLCNRAIWRPLEARLDAAGFAPVRAVNLEPLCDDIDLQARSLEPELLALHQKSNGARVAIVAHSMGGLVVRSFLRTAGSDMISRIVTIAAPHHGTRLARGLHCAGSAADAAGIAVAAGPRGFRGRPFLRSIREHL